MNYFLHSPLPSSMMDGSSPSTFPLPSTIPLPSHPENPRYLHFGLFNGALDFGVSLSISNGVFDADGMAFYQQPVVDHLHEIRIRKSSKRRGRFCSSMCSLARSLSYLSLSLSRSLSHRHARKHSQFGCRRKIVRRFRSPFRGRQCA